MNHITTLHRIVAVTLLALILGACSQRPSASKLEDSSNTMWDRIGTELGKAAANLKPARVLLVRQENSTEINLGPGQDRMENAFKKAIGSGSEVVTFALPAVPLPAQETAASNYNPFRRLEPGYVDEALAKNGAAPLLVSLLGEPTAAPPAGAKWPPVICFSRDGSTNLSDLIKSGVVAAAVAPRHTAPAKGEKEWFELRYTVLNKDNIGSW